MWVKGQYKVVPGIARGANILRIFDGEVVEILQICAIADYFLQHNPNHYNG
jgi:hypothetical protein